MRRGSAKSSTAENAESAEKTNESNDDVSSDSVQPGMEAGLISRQSPRKIRK